MVTTDLDNEFATLDREPAEAVCRLGTRGRQRRPTVRQLRGPPGCLEHGQDALHSASERSCKAALRGALPGAGPAQPDGRNGGFGAARERGLQHLSQGGADVVDPSVECLSATLGNFLCAPTWPGFTVEGFQLEGLNLVMYGWTSPSLPLAASQGFSGNREARVFWLESWGRPAAGRSAPRRPTCPAHAAGRLHLPAHVGLQRLEGHGLRHVRSRCLASWYSFCGSRTLKSWQVPQRLHVYLFFGPRFQLVQSGLEALAHPPEHAGEVRV